MSLKGNQFEEKQRPIPNHGTHIGICYQIIDLGTHMKSFKGQEPQRTPLLHISWEFPQLPEQVFDEKKGPQRLAIFQEYTVSLGDKAKLPAMLKSWRGVAEIKDLEKELPQYLGQPCMINVVHAPSKKTQGIVYANVANNGAGIMRMMDGLPHPGAPKNPKLFFELNPDKGMDWNTFHQIPKWLRDKIRNSFEFPVMLSKFGLEPPNPYEQQAPVQNNTAPVTNFNQQPVYNNNQQGQFNQQNQNGFNNPQQNNGNNNQFVPPVQNNEFVPPTTDIITNSNTPPPF